MSVHPHRREGPTGHRELWFALLVTLTVMLVEVIAGLMSGSLALLADAGHMLTDASALGLSLFAAWMAAKPATPQKTYGYYRTEILAALLNGVALWLLVIWISIRAVQRLHHPPVILVGPMVSAACLGLAANLLSSAILSRVRTANLNIRGARIHILSDALGSCGVITAGVVIHLKGWTLADPLASLVIGGLIAASSWALVKQSVNVLLEATPTHLNMAHVIQAMHEVDGVYETHDLHLWTIATGLEAMSGHVIVEDLAKGPVMLAELNRLLAGRFGITHTTFQLEPRREPADVVPSKDRQRG